MEANNRSRKTAKDVAETFGWKQIGRGNHFVNKMGHKINFTLTARDKIESRQWREDCDYLVCFNETANKMVVKSKSELTVKGVTRIGADGTKYFQAEAK